MRDNLYLAFSSVPFLAILTKAASALALDVRPVGYKISPIVEMTERRNDS
ncbi:hypothetical protein [Pontibacter roseus]|nr:hypothetical protein [Pontibacter roseus]